LLGHHVASGDIAQVLDRALDALVRELEKRKFAATDRPRPPRQHRETDSRHIPADVKRAVWKRDQGQCTFVSDTGHRCPARERLEYDHIDPVARGGRASVSRMRLRCRAHNQYEAERVFGTEFMNDKRRSAQRAAAERRAAAAAVAGHVRDGHPPAGSCAANGSTPSLRAAGPRTRPSPLTSTRSAGT
jgi:5-methylcytosine-specific restriction endonuclease McrA